MSFSQTILVQPALFGIGLSAGLLLDYAIPDVTEDESPQLLLAETVLSVMGVAGLATAVAGSGLLPQVLVRNDSWGGMFILGGILYGMDDNKLKLRVESLKDVANELMDPYIG